MTTRTNLERALVRHAQEGSARDVLMSDLEVQHTARSAHVGSGLVTTTLKWPHRELDLRAWNAMLDKCEGVYVLECYATREGRGGGGGSVKRARCSWRSLDVVIEWTSDAHWHERYRRRNAGDLLPKDALSTLQNGSERRSALLFRKKEKKEEKPRLETKALRFLAHYMDAAIENGVWCEHHEHNYSLHSFDKWQLTGPHMRALLQQEWVKHVFIVVQDECVKGTIEPKQETISVAL